MAAAPAGTCAFLSSSKGRPWTRTPPRTTSPLDGSLECQHRKKAVWGWLAFVIVAFALGNVAGSKPISDVDQCSGESHDAEAALDRAGLRPTSEVVFVQSDKLTIEAPEFRAAVADVARRLPQVPYVENVESPLDGGGSVSADRHAALVDFEIAGDSVEAKERVDACWQRWPGCRSTIRT